MGERGRGAGRHPGARSEAPATDPEPGPGEIESTEPALILRTGDGLVRLDIVQPPGGRRMKGEDWARGRGGEPGETFG